MGWCWTTDCRPLQHRQAIYGRRPAQQPVQLYRWATCRNTNRADQQGQEDRRKKFGTPNPCARLANRTVEFQQRDEGYTSGIDQFWRVCTGETNRPDQFFWCRSHARECELRNARWHMDLSFEPFLPPVLFKRIILPESRPHDGQLP